jgi:hypothetical protein
MTEPEAVETGRTSHAKGVRRPRVAIVYHFFANYRAAVMVELARRSGLLWLECWARGIGFEAAG